MEKKTCLGYLTANGEQAFNDVKAGSYAIVNLNADKKSSSAFLLQWQQLGELAGRDNAPIFCINTINDLVSLIESFASQYNLLVDLNDTALLGDSEMIKAIKNYGAEVNYCLAASAPAPIVRELSKIQEQIPSLSCVCSVTDHDEINQIIEKFAANNLQISAINRVSDLELI